MPMPDAIKKLQDDAAKLDPTSPTAMQDDPDLADLSPEQLAALQLAEEEKKKELKKLQDQQAAILQEYDDIKKMSATACLNYHLQGWRRMKAETQSREQKQSLHRYEAFLKGLMARGTADARYREDMRSLKQRFAKTDSGSGDLLHAMELLPDSNLAGGYMSHFNRIQEAVREAQAAAAKAE